MANDEFMHYGVLGMKWGVRRTPEQLGHTVEKLTKRNEKLQKKTVRANHKSSKWHNKAENSKYSKRLHKAQVGMMEMTATDRQLKRGRKAAVKVRQFNKRYAKWHKRATKYGKEVYKNNTQIKSLMKEMSKLSASEIVAKGNNSQRAKNFVRQRVG